MTMKVCVIQPHYSTDFADADKCFADQLALENGYIKVDAQMATNLPRVYAAGDCTGQPLQLAKAVGQGQLAAHWALASL